MDIAKFVDNNRLGDQFSTTGDGLALSGLLVLADGTNNLFVEVLDDVEVVKDRLDMGQRFSKAS